MDREFSVDEDGLPFEVDQFMGSSLGMSPLGDVLGRTPDDILRLGSLGDMDEINPFNPLDINNPPSPQLHINEPLLVTDDLEIDGENEDGEISMMLRRCSTCGGEVCICLKHRCRICLEKIQPNEMINLKCTHKFHRKCLENRNNEEDLPPNCPICSNRILGNFSGSGIHEYDTYDYLGNFHRSYATTTAIKSRFVCRNVNCRKEIQYTNLDDSIWKCDCESQYCLKCKREAHIGTCDGYDWYLRMNGLTKHTVLQLFQQGKLKRCPKCQIYTHRYNNSHNINCEKCGLHWCWNCIKSRMGCKCRKKSPATSHIHFHGNPPPPIPKKKRKAKKGGKSKKKSSQPISIPTRPSTTPPITQQTTQHRNHFHSVTNHFVSIPPETVSPTKGKRGAQAVVHQNRVYIIRSRNRHFKKENKWYDVYYCEENRKCGCKMSIKSLVGAQPPVFFISRGNHTCSQLKKPKSKSTTKTTVKKKKKSPPPQEQQEIPAPPKVPFQQHQQLQQLPIQQIYGSGGRSNTGTSPSTGFFYNGVSIPTYFTPPLCMDNRDNRRKRIPSLGNHKVNNSAGNFINKQQQQQLQHIPRPPPQLQQQKQQQKPPLVIERVEPYQVPFNFPYARVIVDRSLIHPSIRVGKAGDMLGLSTIDGMVREEHRIITEEWDENVLEIVFKISKQSRLNGWINISIGMRFVPKNGDGSNEVFIYTLPRAFVFKSRNNSSISDRGGDNNNSSESNNRRLKKRKRHNNSSEGDQSFSHLFFPDD